MLSTFETFFVPALQGWGQMLFLYVTLCSYIINGIIEYTFSLVLITMWTEWLPGLTG